MTRSFKAIGRGGAIRTRFSLMIGTTTDECYTIVHSHREERDDSYMTITVDRYSHCCSQMFWSKLSAWALVSVYDCHPPNAGDRMFYYLWWCKNHCTYLSTAKRFDPTRTDIGRSDVCLRHRALFIFSAIFWNALVRKTYVIHAGRFPPQGRRGHRFPRLTHGCVNQSNEQTVPILMCPPGNKKLSFCVVYLLDFNCSPVC